MVVYSEFSVLLWSKALVLDQAEQNVLLLGVLNLLGSGMGTAIPHYGIKYPQVTCSPSLSVNISNISVGSGMILSKL